MKILRLFFQLKAADHIYLPAYTGSVFRGAFGHALKQSVCVTHLNTCTSCPLHAQCAYVYLFETRNTRGEPAPHPYVMEPPLASQRHVARGAIFKTSMVLIGRAVEYVSHVIHAFKVMGQRGVGGKKGRFTLSSVYSIIDGERIDWYDREGSEACASRQLWENLPGTTPVCNRISMHFLTVTALKKQGRMVFDLDFDTLMRAVYRRVKSLNTYHDESQLPTYPDGAHTVKIVDSMLCKEGWMRYSNRQGQHIKFAGFTGTITFEGEDMTCFLPWLEMGRILHIGRGTVYGMGKYELEIKN